MSAESAGQPAIEARFVLEKTGRGASFKLEVELRLDEGVLVLFGPSGAGKTLTLAALAGLERGRDGFVRVRQEVLFDAGARVFVPPHLRGVGYVPQRSSLFRFEDVLGNVAFGLPKATRKRREPTMALLDEIGIAHRARSRPDDLSCGERQRVALARALAVEPRWLLLDEPFASIDRAGRETLGKTLREALTRRKIPAVLVTHDAAEGLELGTLIVPIHDGKTGAAVPPADFFKAAR
jgi:ABC-type sulfate/molybdate transport systems ATPase subunit